MTDAGLALLLSGGGARAAYQVGLLRCLARHRPDLAIPIVSGVSAGAINAVYLASRAAEPARAAEGLSEIWRRLEAEQVFRVDLGSLSRNFLRWGTRLVSGGGLLAPKVRGVVDTAPLRRLLRRVYDAPGGEISSIAEHLEAGPLRALALTTLDYSTGETVTWVQGCDIQDWERPHRRSHKTRMSVDHVLASASLPLLFPAVRLAGSWHGDGGVRLAAPLSPCLHLGATRILVVSTRHEDSEARRPVLAAYPPPAQILGHLLDAVFLDVIDQDVARLERINCVVENLPPRKRCGLRVVRVLAIRPSVDLSALATEYEPRLPKAFRFLIRSLGTRESGSPEFLSLLMFHPEYLSRLIEIGERDAEARFGEIEALLAD